MSGTRAALTRREEAISRWPRFREPCPLQEVLAWRLQCSHDAMSPPSTLQGAGSTHGRASQHSTRQATHQSGIQYKFMKIDEDTPINYTAMRALPAVLSPTKLSPKQQKPTWGACSTKVGRSQTTPSLSFQRAAPPRQSLNYGERQRHREFKRAAPPLLMTAGWSSRRARELMTAGWSQRRAELLRTAGWSPPACGTPRRGPGWSWGGGPAWGRAIVHGLVRPRVRVQMCAGCVVRTGMCVRACMRA